MRLAYKVALLLVLAFVLAAAAGARSTASGTLVWKGWDDRVGGWWNPEPDNIRDAHFTVTLNAPGETVTAITLNPLKPDGTPATGHTWNTIPRDGRWILGIERGGKRLNATDVNICDPVGSRAAHYEIYAEDDKSVATLPKWRVTFRMQSGSEVTIDGALGDTSGGPPAPPASGVPIPSAPQPSGAEPCAASSGDGAVPGGAGTPVGTLRVSLARTAAVAKRAVKAGACATVYSRYHGALPASASVAIERRAAGASAWTKLRAGGAALSVKACAKKRGAASFRSTLRQGTKLLAASNVVTVTWR